MTHVLITAEVARLLRMDGQSLYFFSAATPTLHGVRLDSDDPPRKIVDLEPIHHPRLTSSDPLTYLQRQEDLSVAPGVLCIDLHDRPDQPTLTFNIRVDLVRGTQVRHLLEDLTSAGHDAGTSHTRSRLCTPHGPSARLSADGTNLSLDL